MRGQPQKLAIVHLVIVHLLNRGPTLQDKLLALKDLLLSMERVAIGFSGGVDSTFLSAVCAQCMPDSTRLIHLDTPFVGTPERESFNAAIAQLGLPVTVVKLDPFANPLVAANPQDRCYHCKRAGFAQIVQAACQLGISTVLEGSNADDKDDYRPGMRAVEELGVRSPLMETGWHKDEERQLLREWGFPVWRLPAGACLATRVASGQALTPNLISAIRRYEDLLRSHGLMQVRARVNNQAVRIDACEHDLNLLAGLGGTRLDRDHVSLPPHILMQLKEALSLDKDSPADYIEPIAHAYRKGAMNG